FGMFHDHVLPYSYVALASGNPPFFTTLSDLASPSYNPPFPQDTNLSGAPQFNVFPSTVKEPVKIQYNLTLQQQVMKNTVLEVAYIGSESHHLQENGEWNTTGPTYVNGQSTFPARFLQSNRIDLAFVPLRLSVGMVIAT